MIIARDAAEVDVHRHHALVAGTGPSLRINCGRGEIVNDLEASEGEGAMSDAWASPIPENLLRES